MPVDYLADVRPPIELPSYSGWIWAGLAVILFIAVTVLIRIFISRSTRNSAPFKSAWAMAKERLEHLRQQNLMTPSRVKEYYSELSNIIRRYIEERFDMRAPEMTTEEFLRSLQNSKELSSAHQELLANFLESSDLVKFAKFAPLTSQMEESFRAAQKFIDETTPVPEPSSPQ